MRIALSAALLAVLACAAAAQWCWDADVLRVDVQGADLLIVHEADLINCCPDPITWDMEIGDATLLVQEQWMDLCDCYCCYDLRVRFEDLPPGPWILRYRWFDVEAFDWTERLFDIEVPDLGQSGGPVLGQIEAEGCLEATGLPGLPPSSWTAVKSLYR